MVVADKDVVILKNISAPSLDEFDGLITKARRSAKEVGLKKADIKNAIAKANSKIEEKSTQHPISYRRA